MALAVGRGCVVLVAVEIHVLRFVVVVYYVVALVQDFVACNGNWPAGGKITEFDIEDKT